MNNEVTRLIGASIISFSLAVFLFQEKNNFSITHDKIKLHTTCSQQAEERRDLFPLGSLGYLPDEVTFSNSFADTTGPSIPKLFRKMLRDQIEFIDENVSDHYAAGNAVDKLESLCGWEESSSKLRDPLCFSQIGFSRTPPSYPELFDLDIVIPSIRDLDFLESWRAYIAPYHLIIIQDGDPEKVLKIPDWADYELYNRNDIDKILGKDHSWIISSKDASIRNFGFLVSRKKFIYTLDDDCLPVEGGVNPIRVHMQNLMSNSTPYFFNTLYDPYRDGSDFVRGYPYSLRMGVPTAISHGLWLNAPDYDATTQLLKTEERNTRMIDASITIPHGTFYPLCSMNVAFNRELAGPIFMQGLMGQGQPWGRYDDMFAGWASKLCADKLNWGVKSGIPYIRHNKASNPFTNLKKEYMGLLWQETIIAFFQYQHKIMGPAVSAQQCYIDLANAIETELSSLNAYFPRLARAMRTWVSLWDQAQHGTLQFIPSRKGTPLRFEEFSSMQQIKSDVHEAVERSWAVFTVLRNEKRFLPYWIRYYEKYFKPDDMYIIDNDSSDGCTNGLASKGFNVIHAHREAFYDHRWLVELVRETTRVLLSKGYKRVIFCEIDELIVPSLDIYPNGLSDYRSRMNTSSVAVTAWHIVHDWNNETELDFSAPVLAQRKWALRDSTYDKPLIVDRPLHWVVGFHTASEEVARDEHLMMFHLKRMDANYTIERTSFLAKQSYLATDVSQGLGVQHRFVGEELWNFAHPPDFYTTRQEIPIMFREPPIF